MVKKEDKQKEKDFLDESVSEDEIVKLREENDALRLTAKGLEDQYKRAIADYQNLKKRSVEDRQEWVRTANKDLLLRILEVLDTLLMAQQHVQDKSLDVSIQHFLEILKGEGVARIETVGKEFDPAVMEAISAQEGEEGKVINEVRAGFLLHEKLLRAAQVTVGKK